MESLSIDALKQQHPSRLRNKLMANVFYRSGQIEPWARGTLKIVSNALEGNYPEPEFEYLIGGVLVRFGKKNFVDVNVLEIPKRTENENKVLELIQKQPQITVGEIALQANIAKRSVEIILSKLTDDKIIKASSGNNILKLHQNSKMCLLTPYGV